MVDDGSTDGSRDVLKRYERLDTRFYAIFRDKAPEEEFGEKYSVDMGRSLAQGTYIMIIDHDDELALNMLYVLNGYTQNDTADVVQCYGFYLDEYQELSFVMDPPWKQPMMIPHWSILNTEETLKHMVFYPVALWVCLIRNEFQKDIDLGDYVYNDNSFLWKLKLMSNKWVCIPRHLYKNNLHHDSASQAHDKNYLCNFKIFDDLRSFIEQQGLQDNEKLKKIFALYELHTLYYQMYWIKDPDNLLDYKHRYKEELLKNVEIDTFFNDDLKKTYKEILEFN
jgi:glycosyltransferase involved in cell wall biosynthesis